MSKTYLYRFFGIGGMPDTFRSEAEREGIVVFDEGIPGTVTYINFRGGGRYSNWKRQWYSSSIVLTKTRLLALRLRHPIFDVACDDARLKQIEFSLEGDETLLAAFDASLFNRDWLGRIEYRFRTPFAAKFLDALSSLLTS